MSSTRPQLLLLLFGLVPYLAFGIRVLAKLNFYGASFPEKARSDWERYRARRLIALAIGALFFCTAVLGVVDPIFGARYATEPVRDTETVFVLDVSNSMASVDGASSRLEQARSFIRAVISGTPGNRNALYAFKGTPVLLVPATSSPVAFEDGLSWATTEAVTSPGSDIGLAVSTAVKRNPGGLSRVLVLLTDGNDTGSSADEGFRNAVKSGTRLCIVGIGSPSSSPVFYPDGRKVLDSSGVQFSLPLRNEEMKAAAAKLDALYIDASDTGALALVVGYVNKNRDLKGGMKNTMVRAGVGVYFMAASVCLFFLALAVSRPYSGILPPPGPREEKR